jgi:tryptophan synthase alpha subunit
VEAACEGLDADKPLAQSVGLAEVLQMDLIFLLAPTFTDESMAQVARVASGYVYDVSFKGVRRDNDHH